MRVLFVTCHLPVPAFSGGRRRDYELLRRLEDAADVELCAVSNSYADDAENAELMRTPRRRVSVFPAGEGEPPLADPPRGCGRYWSRSAADHVARLVESGTIDLVHVEGYYLMPLVPRRCRVPVLLVEQNVEHSLWRQRARLAPDHDRPSLLAEERRTRRHEHAAWRRADLCAAVTDEDRDAMAAAVPGLDVRVVPDGADHALDLNGSASEPAIPGGDRPLAVMVANFAYEPSADAGLFLCHEILPRLDEESAPRVLLVGNAPPPALREAAAALPNVQVTGRVASTRPYLDAADIVLCPLRVGGGVKVKVLEALVAGKPIVASGIALQGLNGARAAVAEADGADEFAAAVAALVVDPGRREALATAARAAGAALPTWDDAAAGLLACYRELAGGAQATHARSAAA